MTAINDTLWGHPKGLYILFFTEMWERFSYYGMRTLLIYYMIKQLLFTQADASQIYGLYTGLVYFTPFFGGILADRLWGPRRMVIAGGVLMAIGHFVMAFESLFFPALALLIIGNGAFKPNISTQVGSLYPPDDPRRDRAFSLFYVGINVGAFLSPLICGTLGEVYGWHYGFGAAGVGMVVGLGIYLWGQRWLGPDQWVKPVPAAVETPKEALASHEKERLWGLVVISLVTILFWAAYEQQGNTIALWADEDTDRHIFGWEMPATWFQSLNPLFIFMFTPILTALWAWQSRRRQEPSSATKIAIGCLLLGVSYLVLIPPADEYAADGIPVSMWWLISFNLVLTIGELYLSPIGLSLVCKLAPARMVSMLMGFWFMTTAIGTYSAGLLGQFWEVWPKEYFFLLVAGVAGLAGVIILLLLKPLKRAIGEHAGI
jgi:POT family proton-dependent oligopeptide transporter